MEPGDIVHFTMVYRLKYFFKDRFYEIEDNAPDASECQYEVIAEGLALTSASKNQHEPYGKYTDMNLFVNGVCVWTNQCRIITQNYTCRSLS